MSKNYQPHLDFIVEMIENIEFIVTRHKSITQALSDIEGQMAILMAISQIGETLKKIDSSFLEEFNLSQEAKGAYYTRNYIVHNYEGVDLAFIDNILREHLPKLKEKILKIKDKT